MNEFGEVVLGIAARATAIAVLGLAASQAMWRRGPSAGASATLTAMAVLVGVAGLAASPWPRWWPVPSGGPSGTGVGVVAATDIPATLARTGSGSPPIIASSPPSNAGSELADYLGELRRELVRPTVPDRSSWRWTAWAACGFLAGITFALARLALGLRSVGALRGRSRPVDDPGWLALADSLRSEMGLARPVEIRESTELATAATVGWRSPAVLLPVGWHGWDDRERRAVLAHELAHVLRGDYAAGIAAQLSLALHFYHPLVHALSARLRLQQELAADAWGARLSGGRRPYLTALANLALRQDPKPAAWPARPFLPTRGTFLRRIEMLRDPNAIPISTTPRRGQAVTVAALVAAGLLVAGLRGPVDGPLALAQDPPAAQASPPAVAGSPGPLDPVVASSDVHFVLDFRPAGLLGDPGFKKLAEQLRSSDFKEVAALASGDIEQVLLLDVDPDRKPTAGPRRPAAIVYRAAKPYDYQAFLPTDAQPAEFDGINYLRARPTCYRKLDDRTLLVGSEGDVISPPIGGGRPKGRHAWHDAWKKLPPGAVRMAFDTQFLMGVVMPNPGARRNSFSPLTSSLGPLLDKAQAYALALDAADGLTLEALAICETEPGAGRVADTARAALVLTRNALLDLRRVAETGPDDQARPAVELIDALDAMLASAKVEQDRADVRLHAKADASAVANAARMLLPALGAARGAARRNVSTNNLKQVGLAMHNYHSTNGCFPPAVLYGPDGKTPYSWRVALLPYIEQDGLYQKYKFDEPWDGPSNRKLIAEMPPTYARPGAAPGTTSPACFVLNGPGTAFPARKEGVKISEITDGTSNTILVVEAMRDIPWTKPEDIPYDSAQPLPKRGGLHPGGSNVLFADGSVRFVSDSIDEQVFRHLLTISGGEVIQISR